MKLSSIQQTWLSRIQSEWVSIMKPASTPLAAHLFGPPGLLPDMAASNSRLFASRASAIRSLPKNATVAEVGTQTGAFARRILQTCDPKALHLFDLEFDTLRNTNSQLANDPRVQLHLGDSSSNLEKFPDASFDWIYVDGDHSYEGVKRDADVAERKIRKTGTLIFNDYTIWSPLEMTDYGTVPVVNAIISRDDWEIVYLALHPLMYCDIAIRRRQFIENDR